MTFYKELNLTIDYNIFQNDLNVWYSFGLVTKFQIKTSPSKKIGGCNYSRTIDKQNVAEVPSYFLKYAKRSF